MPGHEPSSGAAHGWLLPTSWRLDRLDSGFRQPILPRLPRAGALQPHAHDGSPFPGSCFCAPPQQEQVQALGLHERRSGEHSQLVRSRTRQGGVGELGSLELRQRSDGKACSSRLRGDLEVARWGWRAQGLVRCLAQLGSSRCEEGRVSAVSLGSRSNVADDSVLAGSRLPGSDTRRRSPARRFTVARMSSPSIWSTLRSKSSPWSLEGRVDHQVRSFPGSASAPS